MSEILRVTDLVKVYGRGGAAARALDANTFSNFSDGRHRVSFDQVVEVMKQTGNDLPSLYKETSEGGLAKYTLR